MFHLGSSIATRAIEPMTASAPRAIALKKSPVSSIRRRRSLTHPASLPAAPGGGRSGPTRGGWQTHIILKDRRSAVGSRFRAVHDDIVDFPSSATSITSPIVSGTGFQSNRHAVTLPKLPDQRREILHPVDPRQAGVDPGILPLARVEPFSEGLIDLPGTSTHRRRRLGSLAQLDFDGVQLLQLSGVFVPRPGCTGR